MGPEAVSRTAPGFSASGTGGDRRNEGPSRAEIRPDSPPLEADALERHATRKGGRGYGSGLDLEVRTDFQLGKLNVGERNPKDLGKNVPAGNERIGVEACDGCGVDCDVPKIAIGGHDIERAGAVAVSGRAPWCGIGATDFDSSAADTCTHIERPARERPTPLCCSANYCTEHSYRRGCHHGSQSTRVTIEPSGATGKSSSYRERMRVQTGTGDGNGINRQRLRIVETGSASGNRGRFTLLSARRSEMRPTWSDRRAAVVGAVCIRNYHSGPG